jgi:hypothetical protein
MPKGSCATAPATNRFVLLKTASRHLSPLVRGRRRLVSQGRRPRKTSAQASLGAMYADGRSLPQDYVQAYMWFNLAASGASDANIRGTAVKARDTLGAKMTPTQIAEAQRLATEWTESHLTTH